MGKNGNPARMLIKLTFKHFHLLRAFIIFFVVYSRLSLTETLRGKETTKKCRKQKNTLVESIFARLCHAVASGNALSVLNVHDNEYEATDLLFFREKKTTNYCRHRRRTKSQWFIAHTHTFGQLLFFVSSSVNKCITKFVSFLSFGRVQSAV